MNIMVCVMTKLASRETSYLQCLASNYRLRRAQVVLNIPIHVPNCMLMAGKRCMQACTHTHIGRHTHRQAHTRTQTKVTAKCFLETL